MNARAALLARSSARVHGGRRPTPLRVGATADAPAKPLLAEPTVVTHGGTMQYISAVGDLVTCLDRDARANLVYQNPGKLHAEASNHLNQAAELDGCTDYAFKCTTDLDPGKFYTPSEILAAELRKKGENESNTADAIDAQIAARGIKNDAAGNARVQSELDFYADLRALAEEENRTYTDISSASIVSSGEWRKVQALDIRYQALRARYIALGFKPSCKLPDFTKNEIPWGWIVVGVFVIGVGVVVAPFLRPLTSMIPRAA